MVFQKVTSRHKFSTILDANVSHETWSFVWRIAISKVTWNFQSCIPPFKGSTSVAIRAASDVNHRRTYYDGRIAWLKIVTRTSVPLHHCTRWAAYNACNCARSVWTKEMAYKKFVLFPAICSFNFMPLLHSNWTSDIADYIANYIYIL